MVKIGIYGGTYNPPHTGHMQAALEAVRLLKLDKLLLIPDRIAPHKEIQKRAEGGRQGGFDVALTYVQVQVILAQIHADPPFHWQNTGSIIARKWRDARFFPVFSTNHSKRSISSSRASRFSSEYSISEEYSRASSGRSFRSIRRRSCHIRAQ